MIDYKIKSILDYSGEMDFVQICNGDSFMYFLKNVFRLFESKNKFFS